MTTSLTDRIILIFSILAILIATCTCSFQWHSEPANAGATSLRVTN